jgi:hypothetical protein
MTANEIQNLADGIPITRLDGVLKETYKPKNGEKNGKPWEVQDAVLQLPDGEVKLKAWNCGDLKDLKGQQIVIEAHKSDRHGWTGCFKEVEEYPSGSKKFYHRVKLTESCKITPANGSQPATRPSQAQTSASATTVEHDEDAADAAVRDARAFAMKAANALLIALEAARHVSSEYEKKHLGDEIPAAQMQAMTSSVFIGLKDFGFIKTLPAHPLKPLVRESVLPEKEEAPKASDEEIPW